MQIQDTKDFLFDIQKEKNLIADQLAPGQTLADRKNTLDLRILIGVDISGSITPPQYKQFMYQIDSIRGLSVVKVIEVDNKIVSCYDYFKTPHDLVTRLQGGGGTEFHEFFEMAKKMKPDAILFMTDGHVQDSVRDPGIPTGWVLTADGVHPYGFGEVVLKLPYVRAS